MNSEEEWRPIPGFAGYEASSQGRLRSWKRAGPGVHALSDKPKVLKCKTNSYGYFVVTISKMGAPKTCTVHRLVYTAFKGPAGDDLVVRHLDGNPTNNIPRNLALGTHEDNKQDSIAHGTHAKGVSHGRAKLTEEQVKEIRSLYAARDCTQSALAKRFDIAQQLVSQVVHRKVWTHIA